MAKRARPEEARKHHGGSHREYMRLKAMKLKEQWGAAAEAASDHVAGEALFENEVFWVNGGLATSLGDRISGEEMRHIITRNGGGYRNTEDPSVTIVLCRNLDAGHIRRELTIKRKKPKKFLRPDWVLDCVKEGSRLPWRPYVIEQLQPKGPGILDMNPQQAQAQVQVQVDAQTQVQVQPQVQAQQAPAVGTVLSVLALDSLSSSSAVAGEELDGLWQGAMAARAHVLRWRALGADRVLCEITADVDMDVLLEDLQASLPPGSQVSAACLPSKSATREEALAWLAQGDAAGDDDDDDDCDDDARREEAGSAAPGAMQSLERRFGCSFLSREALTASVDAMVRVMAGKLGPQDVPGSGPPQWWRLVLRWREKVQEGERTSRGIVIKQHKWTKPGSGLGGLLTVHVDHRCVKRLTLDVVRCSPPHRPTSAPASSSTTSSSTSSSSSSSSSSSCLESELVQIVVTDPGAATDPSADPSAEAETKTIGAGMSASAPLPARPDPAFLAALPAELQAEVLANWERNCRVATTRAAVVDLSASQGPVSTQSPPATDMSSHGHGRRRSLTQSLPRSQPQSLSQTQPQSPSLASSSQASSVDPEVWACLPLSVQRELEEDAKEKLRLERRMKANTDGQRSMRDFGFRSKQDSATLKQTKAGVKQLRLSGSDNDVATADERAAMLAARDPFHATPGRHDSCEELRAAILSLFREATVDVDFEGGQEALRRVDGDAIGRVGGEAVELVSRLAAGLVRAGQLNKVAFVLRLLRFELVNKRGQGVAWAEARDFVQDEVMCSHGGKLRL